MDGAKYFGVQASRKCFCGTSYGKHGESSECTAPCSGDEDQVCGAVNVNSVYTLLAPEDVEPAEVEAADMDSTCENNGYCGCFVDSTDKPLLTEGGLDFFDRYYMYLYNKLRSSCSLGGCLHDSWWEVHGSSLASVKFFCRKR